MVPPLGVLAGNCSLKCANYQIAHPRMIPSGVRKIQSFEKLEFMNPVTGTFKASPSQCEQTYTWLCLKGNLVSEDNHYLKYSFFYIPCFIYLPFISLFSELHVRKVLALAHVFPLVMTLLQLGGLKFGFVFYYCPHMALLYMHASVLLSILNTACLFITACAAQQLANLIFF